MARHYGKLAVIAAVLLILVLATACSSDNNKQGNSSNTEGQASTQTNTNEGNSNDNSQVEENFDPFGKYDPPITVTSIRGEAESIKYPPGEDMENNIWIDSFRDELGINLKYDWVVTAEQFEQKLNLAMVSGELPDFYKVNARQLQQLVNANKVKDLTDVYNNYASDMLKQMMEENNSVNLLSVTFDEKIMAIPAGGVGVDNVPMIWLRTDWLDNLGLEPPKTRDDVLNIIRAFTFDDPDQNGKDDTFGLNLNKDIYSGYSGVQGFFAMYGAYNYNDATQLTMWLEKGGQLENASIQPEVKEALAELQKLYNEGAIDPEFSVYDPTKSAENQMSGKTGFHFGTFSNTGWPLRAFKEQNPEGDFRPFPIPDANGVAKMPVPNVSAKEYYVVNVDSEHPEVLIKLLNYYFLKVVDPETAEPEKYHSATIDDQPYTMFMFSPVTGGLSNTNQRSYEEIKKAFEGTISPDDLNAGDRGLYDAIVEYREGNNATWFREPQFGPEGAFSVLEVYKDNNLFVFNEFSGAPTATMVSKGSTLTDLEIQMLTRIIMGASLDEFDQFVADWKSLGGDQITAEVNEWYSMK